MEVRELPSLPRPEDICFVELRIAVPASKDEFPSVFVGMTGDDIFSTMDDGNMASRLVREMEPETGLGTSAVMFVGENGG